MNDKTEDLLQDNRETLEALAQSDLRTAKWAQKLLDSLEGDSSYSTSEPTETNVDRDISPQNPPEEQSTEPEGSIFAY